jgi:hypothetical protein
MSKLREEFEKETGSRIPISNGAEKIGYYQDLMEWVEAKLTTHNSQYAKCLECDERQANNPRDSYCGNCGRHFA